MNTLYSLPSKQHIKPIHTALRLSILVGVVSVGMVKPAVVYAATNQPNDIQPKDYIEQQQRWQDALKEQRIESLRQAQSEETKEEANQLPFTESESSSVTPDASDKACLSVQRIELGSLPELSKRDQAKLRHLAKEISYTPHATSSSVTTTQSLPQNDQRQSLSNCVSVANANKLIRRITEAYLDDGFFKINIEQQASDPTRSIWHVYVAKVTAIDNQTELPTTRLFGNIIDKPVNIAALDQAVSNGEQVIDGQLLLDIYPVGNDVRIKATQQGNIDTISADLEWRYKPDDSYGHNLLSLQSTLRNIAGQADLTSVSIQQSLTDKYGYDDDNQRRSASIYTFIPNGRWKWSGLLAADEYTRYTKLPNSTLEQTGDSWQANLRGDYTFDRDQDSISTLYAQVAHQDVTSELLGSRLDIQSPTISSARIGASHTKLFNKRSKSDPNNVTSGAWVIDLGVDHGFGNHDNPASEQGLSDDYLRWLLSGYLTHQHPFASSGPSNSYWQMTHEIQGQYSEDQLYGITQQSLGSTYSGVRGINTVYSGAETGVTLRNTLSYEPNQTSWLTLGSHRLRWAPYIGADYGMVKNSETELDDDTSEAASGTLGLKLIGYDVNNSALDKRWLLDVSASRAKVDYADERVDGTQDTEVSAAWKWYF